MNILCSDIAMGRMHCDLDSEASSTPSTQCIALLSQPQAERRSLEKESH